MEPLTIGILILAGVAAIGTIIWYAVWGKKEEADIDAGDVTLLAMGLEDPSLGVSAYTVGCNCGDDCDCGLDDGIDDTIDLSTQIASMEAFTSNPDDPLLNDVGGTSNVDTVPSSPDEPVLKDIGGPSNVDTGSVWTHVETPASDSVSKSTWSHEDYGSSSSRSDDYSSSSSSYDSGSSSSSYDSGSSNSDSGGED